MLRSVESGQIPIITDAKCFKAAQQIAGNGFTGICDWHTEQRGELRSEDDNLEIFDAESPRKWKVCTLQYICAYL